MEVFVEKFDTIENIKSSILKLCIKINKNISCYIDDYFDKNLYKFSTIL